MESKHAASPLTLSVGNIVLVSLVGTDESVQARIMAVGTGADPSMITIALRGLSVPAPYRIGDMFAVDMARVVTVLE